MATASDTSDERRQVHMSKMFHAEGMTPELAIAAYNALLEHFEKSDQKPVADAIRYGFKSHDYEPARVDCGPDCCGSRCMTDVCIRCGQAADSDDWTEFCIIDYPETS